MLVRKSLLAFGAAALFARTTSALSQKTLEINFPDTPTSSLNVVYDNFLGGETPDTLPDAMQNYLANVRARMDHELRIRIGGNSMDGSTYVANQTNMITLSDPDAYYNDVPCDFGPMLFNVLNAMQDKVGSMAFILGLSMRTPDEPDDVLQLTAAAEQYLGYSLDALLLGNEPDLYAGHGERANYTIQDYIPEISTMLDEMRNSSYGNLLENKVIGGPSVCCSWDLDDVLDAGMDDMPYKYYTCVLRSLSDLGGIDASDSIQHYPTNVCSGVNAQTANISYYVSHANTLPFLSWNDAGVEIAEQVNVPMLMTEYNSASCGGDPTVAPSFAAGLWAVDTALQGAALNFSGMYLHTREIGVTYNLFEPSDSSENPAGDWKTGATYYPVLVLAEALSTNGSLVVDLNLDGSTTSYDASVAGYAIYDSRDGEFKKSKLVLFNFDYPTSGSENAVDTTQNFTLPANLTSQIGVRYLLAPNISTVAPISSNYTSGQEFTWAGQTANSLGALQGTQQLDTIDCANGCNVTVPGPGLALVWLDADQAPQLASIYEGNSTIAGIGTDGKTASQSGAAGLRLKLGEGRRWAWIGAGLSAVVAMGLL